MHIPALLFVEFVSHAFREFLKVAFGFRVVGVDHKVLEVPKPPAQVLETLTLLQEASDLGADLPNVWRRVRDIAVVSLTFHVFVNASASLKLLNGTKDLLP